MKRTFVYLRILILLLSLGLLAGCATVNQKPFAKYSSAVLEAQSGIDAAMSVNYNWTRSGFIEGFSSNTNSKFSQIMIQPDEEGYGWKLAANPLYLQIKETRSGLAELNEAFANYADLLAKLAGDDLVSTDTFDQLAENLNENTRDAAKALSFEAPSQGFSLFSTAASEAARLYIENRRLKYLKEAIEENQANVDEYSEQCVSLLHTIRGSIKTYYVERVEPVKHAWNGSTGEKRQKNTEVMLNLNEQYADTMRVLQELETTYSELPKAHADLAKAIEKPKFNLNGIQKLYASGKRLQKLYSQLEKAEAKSTKSEQP